MYALSNGANDLTIRPVGEVDRCQVWGIKVTYRGRILAQEIASGHRCTRHWRVATRTQLPNSFAACNAFRSYLYVERLDGIIVGTV